MRARMPLMLAAGVEIGTAFVLIAAPSHFAALVFEGELSDAGAGLARLSGFSLLSLVWAVWPGTDAARPSALRAMLLFSALCALYLLERGALGVGIGVLLWPACVAHGVLAVLLARATREERSDVR